jgi:transmembrane sensor
LASAEDIARDEAIAWRNRLGNADEGEWSTFIDWLARDPINSQAYDRVASTDAALSEALAVAPVEERPRIVSNTVSHSPNSRRYATWFSAVAAVVALVIFGYPLLFGARGLEVIETRPGLQRTVELAGGSTIYLNGGSRILIDRNDARFARLEYGEAAFKVVHDAGSPFTVEVNGATIRDLGTVFNISTSPNGFELAVAEGAVVLNPRAENVRLSKGGMLFVPKNAAPISVGSTNVNTIASWRRGKLVYDDEPLENVALDLSRTLGTQVTVEPAIAHLSFTGVIIPVRDEKLFFQRLEHLLGVKASRSDAGWRLGPGHAAAKSGDAVRGRH